MCSSVCLFVCLFAHISQKPHFQISPNFLYLLPVAVAWSSTDNGAVRYSCTSGFVDDVMFSHHGANGQNHRLRDDAYVSSSSPGGGTGATINRFRLHLITGPPTHSVGGQTTNGRLCLSSSVVCNLAGGRAGRPSGAWAVGRPTLHGGPVRLRPVRATPCLLSVFSTAFSVYMFRAVDSAATTLVGAC